MLLIDNKQQKTAFFVIINKFIKFEHINENKVNMILLN